MCTRGAEGMGKDCLVCEDKQHLPSEYWKHYREEEGNESGARLLKGQILPQNNIYSNK